MKEVEHFTFMLPPDIWSKKGGRSTYKMSIKDAAERYPGATPILNTREVIQVPETPAEEAERAKYFCGYTKGGPTSEEIFASWKRAKAQVPQADSDNGAHEPD